MPLTDGVGLLQARARLVAGTRCAAIGMTRARGRTSSIISGGSSWMKRDGAL